MQWKPYNCILYEETLETVILTQSANHWSKVLHLPKPTDGPMHRNQPDL